MSKKQIPVSTRDLKIWYLLDNLTADEIAEKINYEYSINCTGDDVEKLLKERKVQTRKIRRSEPTFVFVDPDTYYSTELKGEKLPFDIQ